MCMCVLVFAGNCTLAADICICAQAYVDIVRHWGWKTFTIIYENNDGIVRLQELLKAHGMTPFPITVRQLSDSGDYRWVHL